MPTVNQMATLGDTLTSATLLQPAHTSFTAPECTHADPLDTTLRASYGVNNIDPNPAGASLGWDHNTFSATPEIVSGSLMTYKA